MVHTGRNVGKGALIAWSAAIVLACVMPAGGQCEYDVEILPNFDCGLWQSPGIPKALNNLGHVGGWGGSCAGPSHSERPFVWTGGPTLQILPLPSYAGGGQVHGLNDLGDAVGFVWTGPFNNLPRACMWMHDGQFVDLGLLPGANQSEALAINNNRQITGFSLNDATNIPPLTAFLWQDGVMIGLDFPLGPYSVAYDISEDAKIVGWMGTVPHIGSHAFLWDGKVTDLGVIPGGFSADARAISDDGSVIAGVGRIPQPGQKFGYNRAFVWRDGVMEDIGVLPGYSESLARGPMHGPPLDIALDLPAHRHSSIKIVKFTGWTSSLIQF